MQRVQLLKMESVFEIIESLNDIELGPDDEPLALSPFTILLYYCLRTCSNEIIGIIVKRWNCLRFLKSRALFY